MTPRDDAARLARNGENPPTGTMYGRVLGPPIGVMLPSSNQIVERVTEDVLGLIPGVHACYSRVPYWGARKGTTRRRLRQGNAACRGRTAVAHGACCTGLERNARLGLRLRSRQGPEPRCRAALRHPCGHDLARRSGSAAAFRGEAHRHGNGGIGPLCRAHGGKFRRRRYRTAALHNFGEMDNARQAGVDPAPVAEFARNAVRQAGAEAILIWSTNLPGHGMAAGIERQTGMPVFDSAAIGIWAGLSILRHDMSAAAGRGRLFAGS